MNPFMNISFLKIYNLQFDQEAVQFLEANASVDLHLLENEIKKLSLFLGAERFVSKQVAEQMLSQTVDSSALALVEAVISRNYEEARSEEHTSELQSRGHLVCRLLLEKKKKESSTGGD